MTAAYCFDCKMDYNNFPCDFVIQNGLWKLISPSKNEGGLLCPNCMCKRLKNLGLTAVVATIDTTDLISDTGIKQLLG